MMYQKKSSRTLRNNLMKTQKRTGLTTNKTIQPKPRKSLMMTKKTTIQIVLGSIP